MLLVSFYSNSENYWKTCSTSWWSCDGGCGFLLNAYSVDLLVCSGFFPKRAECLWSAIFCSQKNKTFQSLFNLLALVDLPVTVWVSTVLSHSFLFVLQFTSGEAMTLSLMHYAGFMHCHGSVDLFICCGSFSGTFVALNYQLRILLVCLCKLGSDWLTVTHPNPTTSTTTSTFPLLLEC